MSRKIVILTYWFFRKLCILHNAFRNGKRKDKPYFIRLYNPTEIRDLLNRAGLELHKIYSNWNAEPFTNNSRRMIIIAKK